MLSRDAGLPFSAVAVAAVDATTAANPSPPSASESVCTDFDAPAAKDTEFYPLVARWCTVRGVHAGTGGGDKIQNMYIYQY